VVPGNGVGLLPSAAAAITAMLDAMDAARDHLHLEYYIFDDVRIGGRSVAESLLAARARGVQVAVIYDGVGSLGTPAALIERLERAGVQTLEFRSLNPFRRQFNWRFNERDHRKILIADGRTAFLGGVNLSRVYENPETAGVLPDPAKSFWHDCAVRVHGPVVEWVQRIFLHTWERHGGGALARRDLFPYLQPQGPHHVRVAASVPAERQRVYFEALHAAVAEARQRILLTTGYFVPARIGWRMLADAARRGVAVDLVLPGHSDVPATLHAGRALYGRLLQAGVRIHEMQDGLLHAKAATIDGVWSVVGSSNFDRRSYSLNNEVDAVLLGRDMAAGLEALLTGWMGRATEVTYEKWSRRSWGERAQEHLARLWERYL